MILVVDMNWKKNSLGYYEFVLPIVTIVKKMKDCLVKHFTDITAEDVFKAEKVILSGTALRDNFALAQRQHFRWIKTISIPVLGICAGMQVIGIIFGLNLLRCSEIGMTEITTSKENFLFSSNFKAFSLHNYCVESNEKFEILATSAKCAQSLRHKKQPIYGVLFHPEVRNEEILKRFLQLTE